MNCLVTGASGFIGSSLTKRLVKEGYSVKALIHKNKPKSFEKDIQYITGDITDPSSLKTAVENVDLIFHCAAFVRDFGPKDVFYKINYEGTKNIVDACKEQKIKRFIFLGHVRYESVKKFSYYTFSKEMAEQFLLDTHKNDNFPVVVIRPGNVYGPGLATWVIRPLKAIQKNRISLINNGNGIFHHTYIDNLLDAILVAIKEPKAIGEIIDITDGDHSTTWGQYLNDLAEMTGKSPIKKNMSKNTALALGNVTMLLYNTLRIKPWFTPMAVEVFTNQKRISIKKAESLLGYKPKIDYKEGMKRVENWLKTEGHIT